MAALAAEAATRGLTCQMHKYNLKLHREWTAVDKNDVRLVISMSDATMILADYSFTLDSGYLDVKFICPALRQCWQAAVDLARLARQGL